MIKSKRQGQDLTRMTKGLIRSFKTDQAIITRGKLKTVQKLYLQHTFLSRHCALEKGLRLLFVIKHLNIRFQTVWSTNMRIFEKSNKIHVYYYLSESWLHRFLGFGILCSSQYLGLVRALSPVFII